GSTWADRPAPASSTTCIFMWCRGGTATPTSCPWSATCACCRRSWERRRRDYGRCSRRSPHDLLGDRLELQVRRPLVDLADLRIPIELLDRVVLHEAVAAVEIDGERRHPLGDFRGENLRHRRLREERLAGVAEA